MTLIYHVSDFSIKGWGHTDWTQCDWYQENSSLYAIIEIPIDFFPAGHLIFIDPSQWKIDPETLALSPLE